MEQAASARRQNCVSAALSAVGGAAFAGAGGTYLAMDSLEHLFSRPFSNFSKVPM
jgi:hypothetical protein